MKRILTAFIIIFVFSLSVAYADYHDEMVSHWTFDNETDIGHDDFGDHDGTVTGGTWQANGLVNGGLDFNGTSDYIEVSPSTDFSSEESGQMTFSAFIQSDNYNTRQVIISRRTPVNNQGHFNIYVHLNRLYFAFYSDYTPVGTHYLYSGPLLEDGQAYQIVWLKKWDELGTRLFVNGVEQAVYGDTDSKGTSYTDNPVFIGAENSSGVARYFFNGIIDDVAIWNRILTMSELATFTGQTFLPTDYYDEMVSHWTFDNETDIGHDDFGDHDGTVTGGTWQANGLINGGLDFNGTSDYIEVSPSTDFSSGESGQMTFSAFIQSDNYNTRQVIISRRHPTNNQGHFNIFVYHNRLYFSFYSNYSPTGTHELYSGQLLENGQAYQIVWLKKWDELGTRLFVNGVEQAVYGDTDSKGTSYTNLPVFIGAENSSGVARYFFNGIIDDVAIWNRILTMSELATFTGQTFQPASFNKNPAAIKLYKNAINVKDFGAVGDGVTDDTEAINLALHSARLNRSTLLVGNVEGYLGGAGDAVIKTVIFPPGIYKITDTLVGYREMRLQGIGKAVIKQTNSAKDIYYQHEMYRSYIDNLEFEGGKNQLRFWSANNDATLIFITNCRFLNSSKAAIRCFSYREELADGTKKVIGPYEVSTDAYNRTYIISEYDVSQFLPWRNSTLLAIDECEFENCINAFNIGTDGAVVENCKIIANPNTEGPVMICNDRKLDIRNLECEAPASSEDQYWIKLDETGSETFTLSCRNSTFLSVNPMCLIKLSNQPWYESTSIIVDNCDVNSAGCTEGGIVEFNTLPNTFYFTNNREASGNSIKAVAWNMAETAQLFEDQKYFNGIATNSQFNFCITGNDSNIDETLPVVADSYLRSYPSGTLLSEVSFDVDTIFTDNYWPEIKNPIYAVNYGVVGNGSTDDSAALQQAFDAAAQLPNSAVILPAKKIMIASTIQLPKNIIITSTGTTYLIGDGSINAFSGSNIKSLLVTHLGFKGFKSAFDLTTSSSDISKITIHNCKFYNGSESQIKLISGNLSEENNTILEIKNCLLRGVTMVETNAAYSKLSNIWLHGSWLADDQAYIVNHGGSMLIESVLGVPRGLKGQNLTTSTEEIVVCPYGDNMRWFDNYGKLVIKDMRFGGEAGGFCAVRNLSSDATLFMQGGFTTMDNEYTENCYVYFEEAAEHIVVIANNNIPGQKSRSIWMKSPTCPSISSASVFISGPGVGMAVTLDGNNTQNAHYQP
jgi:Concanavalin A-like lectin/glucanases superfamily/Pectate lyase superfamily protein